MTQKEFESRVGLTVTADYYHKVIEPPYYDYCGDKDAYCEDWKESHKGINQTELDVIMNELVDVFKSFDNHVHSEYQLSKTVDEKDEEIDKLHNAIDDWRKTHNDLEDDLCRVRNDYNHLQVKFEEMSARYFELRMKEERPLEDWERECLQHLMKELY